jgi:hypothetical protein
MKVEGVYCTVLFMLEDWWMAERTILYPRSLEDIPRWRQRELEADLLWFSRYSPSKRLAYIDREWEQTERFIQKFSLERRWKRQKKSTS